MKTNSNDYIVFVFYLQKSEEQKLIYSGQLLNDSTVLKDILRQYEGQDTHTVHLVFTPKNTPGESSGTVKPSASSANNSEPPTTAEVTSTNTPPTEGLRYLANI